MQKLSSVKCFDGEVAIYKHASTTCAVDMKFSVFIPPQAKKVKVPVLYYLAGLTCTEETFMIKAGAQKYAAEHGLMLVAPDTSPRGAGVPGEADSWDFGVGAGFYIDATREPWSKNYNMYSYVTKELPALINRELPADPKRVGITGHSMGGHGALVLALRNPDIYRSISAFAPICAPTQCPWGEKGFTNYLGDDRKTWEQYDAHLLVKKLGHQGAILVDQGGADKFLKEQLKPELLVEACKGSDVKLQMRTHEGYDHGYYFIQTFMADHIAFHAEILK